ncbi:hypothetical protein NC99_38650 [Sunxiuqinia dokdonensis]|uniref:Uncharacterized protein n=1 Tax=Sunxiuqinia dokdonensis TaxID=1409788 RepID=A0A0L8V482_9BACT|nr:hypothetical protein NC99_38650 [Sunxiuqinia dokdonensis]
MPDRFDEDNFALKEFNPKNHLIVFQFHSEWKNVKNRINSL